MKRLIVALKSEPKAIAYGAEIFWKNLFKKYTKMYYSTYGQFYFTKFRPEISTVDYIESLECDVITVSSGKKLLKIIDVIEKNGLILDKNYSVICGEDKGFIGITIFPTSDEVIGRIEDEIEK